MRNASHWLSTTALGLTLALAPVGFAADAQSKSGQTQESQPQDQMKASSFTGRVAAVDNTRLAFRVEGTDQDILITASTRFSDGLSIEKLEPGMMINVVAVNTPEGKWEARLVTATGQDQPTEEDGSVSGRF